MSDDYERTNRGTESEQGGSLPGEEPLAAGDVAFEEPGYESGARQDPSATLGSAAGGFADSDTDYRSRDTGPTGYDEASPNQAQHGDTEPGGAQHSPTQPMSTEYGAAAFDSGSPASTGSGAASSSTTDVAKDQGQQVGQEAVAGGQHVAGVAADEAKNVMSEAGTQAKNLAGEARSQLSSQASTQQNNLAAWLRDLSSELGSMADRSNTSDTPSGPATHLVQQSSDRAHSVASWLEEHEPADALDQVTRFARQRPGMFLALAAVGGLLAGRLTRGLTSDSSNDSTPTRSTPTRSAATDPGLGAADMSSNRLADDDPYLSGPAGVPVSPVDDDAWPRDEGAGRPGMSSDVDFGLPDERGPAEVDSGYADDVNPGSVDESDRPFDQGRR